MRRQLKERTFRAELPWLDKYLPRIIGGYECSEQTIDTKIFDREVDGFGKERILLLNRAGEKLGQVRRQRRVLGFALLFLQGESVGQAFERLGKKAWDVAYILTVKEAMNGKTYATVWHARGSTKMANLWRREAIKEEAGVRRTLQAVRT